MPCGIALKTGVVLVLSLFSLSVLAQDKPGSKPAAPPGATQPKAKPRVQPSQPQVVKPDAQNIVLLRNKLITLNDAIRTGDFTVLRDTGAPDFRDADFAARLSQSFSDLASRGVDLSVVSVLTPQLIEPPNLDQQKGHVAH